MLLPKSKVDIINEQLNIKLVKLRSSMPRGRGRTKKVITIYFIPYPSQPKIHEVVKAECYNASFNDICETIDRYMYENYRLPREQENSEQ